LTTAFAAVVFPASRKVADTPEHSQIALWILLGLALLVSVVTDLLSARILDVVTYPTLLLGLGIRFFAEGPGTLEDGFLSGGLGAIVMGVVFGTLSWRGSMGWGDAKLAMAVGGCLGFWTALAALLFISLCGALQAVVWLLWRGELAQMAGSFLRRAAERLKLRPSGPAGVDRKIPYGVSIALGTLWAMWWHTFERTQHP
jgi:prepilin peptidase CpaA